MCVQICSQRPVQMQIKNRIIEHFGKLILMLRNVMKKYQAAASDIFFSQFPLTCLWYHRNLREISTSFKANRPE